MVPVDFVKGDYFEEMEELSRALFGTAWDEADDDAIGNEQE